MKKSIAILAGLVLILFLLPQTMLANDPFPDVSFTHANAGAIQYLKTQGVISGDAQTGRFAPARTLNRAEFAKMIVTAKEWSVADVPYSPVFPDVPQGEWYTPYILKAYERGVLQGNAQGKAEPGKPLLMAEALAMSMRAFGFTVGALRGREAWYAPYLKTAQEKLIIDNSLVEHNTILTPPAKVIPRGEAAQLVYNASQIPSGAPTQTYHVLLCMMRWNASDPALKPSDLGKVLADVNAYFNEVSYGRMGFEFHFAGNTVYQGALPADFGAEAQAAALTCDPTIDFDEIDRMIIYPSRTFDLSFYASSKAQTQEGEKQLKALFIRDFLIGHLVHEMGHSFSGIHIHGLECGPSVVSTSDCRIASYANPYDPLGEPTFAGHFSGWNKVKFGWADTQEITESGTYELPALETWSLKPPVLRVSYADGSALCMDYRKPKGFDDFAARGVRDRIASLVKFPPEGALLLYTCPDNGIMTLLDTTPQSKTSETLADFADGYLKKGQVFTNVSLGLTVSFTNQGDSAQVTIQKNAEGSVPILPEVINFE